MRRSLEVAALLLITVAAAGHHGTSTFDSQQEIILQGIVTTFEWVNPHVYITIETANSAGEEETGTIEGPTRAALTIADWSEHSLSPGERVVVVANPTRDANATIVLGNSVLKEGGEYLPMGSIRLQEALAGQRGQ